MPATKPNSQWPKIDDPSFHEISNKIESKGLQARCREPRQGGAERPIALQDGAGAMSGYEPEHALLMLGTSPPPIDNTEHTAA